MVFILWFLTILYISVTCKSYRGTSPTTLWRICTWHQLSRWSWARNFIMLSPLSISADDILETIAWESIMELGGNKTLGLWPGFVTPERRLERDFVAWLDNKIININCLLSATCHMPKLTGGVHWRRFRPHAFIDLVTFWLMIAMYDNSVECREGKNFFLEFVLWYFFAVYILSSLQDYDYHMTSSKQDTYL